MFNPVNIFMTAVFVFLISYFLNKWLEKSLSYQLEGRAEKIAKSPRKALRDFESRNGKYDHLYISSAVFTAAMCLLLYIPKEFKLIGIIFSVIILMTYFRKKISAYSMSSKIYLDIDNI